MPRLALPSLAIGLTAAAALALVACGGEDAQLLPGETAREITANLDTVQQLADEGDCLGAESAAQQVGEQIETLKGVDDKLKRALESGAVRLEEAIAGCEESSTEAIAPATIPTEPEEEDEKPPKEKKDEEKKANPKDGETAPKAPPASPSLPPQAKGEGKGLEEGNGPPPGEGEGGGGGGGSPSGGVGPGSPVDGGE